MVLFVNTQAAAGTALAKWRKIEQEFRRRFQSTLICLSGNAFAMNDIIRHALLDGETDFAAAGGDGTINALLNSILAVSAPNDLIRVRIGAIGLGSSNDYHKPFVREQFR